MNEIATRDAAQELVATVRADGFKAQVAAALPPTVTPERFVRSAITALLANPDIAQAERDSIFQSLLRAAQDGLLPDGREAALVMFGKKATYMPMVQGFRKIAAEHGFTLISRVVYQADEFEHQLGTDENILHRPAAPGVSRGDLIAAYAIAKHVNGAREVEVMYRDEIERVKSVSRASKSGPWVEWYDRMAEKTVTRRLFAKLPLGELDPRVQRIIEASRVEPADAAQAIYGTAGRAALESGSTTPPVKPGESDGHGTEPVARQQVAGAAGASHEGATAAAPATPDPNTPEGESLEGEPDTGGDSQFQPPAGAVVDESIKALADGAALAIVPNGKNKGRTIADVAADPSPESWFRYMLATPDHPVHAAVLSYSRFYFPELVEAMEQKAAAAREVAA